MIEELLPCPFCNSEQVDVKIYSRHDLCRWHQVFCKKCGARVERRSREAAVTLWNTRGGILPHLPKQGELNDMQKNLIILLAKRNMNVSDAARKTCLTRSQVDTGLQQIKREIGLDPFNFFDLHTLYKMATGEAPK